MGSAVVASQSRATLSLLPVRTVCPSGLNATDRKALSCGIGGPIGCPVAAFQSRPVPS